MYTSLKISKSSKANLTLKSDYHLNHYHIYIIHILCENFSSHSKKSKEDDRYEVRYHDGKMVMPEGISGKIYHCVLFNYFSPFLNLILWKVLQVVHKVTGYN